MLIANNNAMTGFDFFSLRYAGSGISLFQNPTLASFEAPRLTAVASGAANDVITTGLQVRTHAVCMTAVDDWMLLVCFVGRFNCKWQVPHER